MGVVRLCKWIGRVYMGNVAMATIGDLGAVNIMFIYPGENV
jgi:hypothetical protein